MKKILAVLVVLILMTSALSYAKPITLISRSTVGSDSVIDLAGVFSDFTCRISLTNASSSIINIKGGIDDVGVVTIPASSITVTTTPSMHTIVSNPINHMQGQVVSINTSSSAPFVDVTCEAVGQEK